MNDEQFNELSQKLDRIIELLGCMYKHAIAPPDPTIVQGMMQAAIEERAKYDQAMHSEHGKQ